MPEITVVIPVYNVKEYLNKCVESVLAQSFTDYEILLIDDGSTDGSGQLCDEIAEHHDKIKVIHQENKGLGGARNTGIEHCKSEYVLFLDSDDFIHPDLLKLCFEPAKKYDCDFVFFDSIAVYSDGSKGMVYSCPFSENRLLNENDCRTLVYFSGAWNRLYKVSLFTEHNIYFPNKVWYEDLRTVTKMTPFVKHAYYCKTEPLHYYLQRSGSIMHTPDYERIVKERLQAVEEVETYYESLGLQEKYKDEIKFLRIYHGYFLPVREMQSTGRDFEKYADRLRTELLAKYPNPLSNKYLSMLSSREQQMLRWFLNRKYKTVRLFSALNKMAKKIKNIH